jgi:hypothetical protein
MPKSVPPVRADASERTAAPQPFVGHESIVDYFRKIGPAGLAHAYLFHGPRGVGKTTFARILALTLHCERPTSFPTGYCGTCAACIRGIAGSSGDTIYVDLAFIRSADELAHKEQRKTDTFGIETSRLIVRRMEMRSYEGGRLVCIIPGFDNVPYGRDEVYNALLKELEEPDSGKVFLLTTQRPERILPTIRSRTVSLRFDALRDEDVARALVEQYGEEPPRALAMARRAEGSLGEALEQREQGAAELREASRAWALSCLAKPAALPPMPELGKEDARTVLSHVLRYGKLAVRDLLAYSLLGARAVIDAEAAAEYERAFRSIGTSTAARAIAALEQFAEADRLAATNISPAIVLGWLQVRLRSAAA